MLRLATAIGVRLARLRTSRQARRLDHSLRDCRAAQQRTLARLLELNAGTAFQRDHGLRPGLSMDELRRQMPLTTYDDISSYVARVAAGEVSALCGPANPPLMFAQSSGTTGHSKRIPVTRRFVDDYRRSWNIWAWHAFNQHPAVPFGRFFQIISDFDRNRTASGLPCGNISGLVQSMQPPFVRTRFVLPAALMQVHDPGAKAYLTLRLGLTHRHLGLISTANPSTLVQLAKTADAHCESLIRDLHDGELAADCRIPEAVRQRLQRQLHHRHPARARELEDIVERTGHLRPRDVWPQPTLISVWTGGSAAAYLPEVRRLYGDMPIRDHGLSASEGRMTIPLDDETPSGILDVESHFFEFIPEDQADSAQPDTLFAHELEQDSTYFIVLTTASGLYRYHIQDVVRCTGFLGTTPLLQFLHKGAHISNVTGEKLTESQAVAAVAQACHDLGLRLGHYTLCPVWGAPPAYHLLIEDGDLPQASFSAQLAAAVDAQLHERNCEYHEKRDSERLGPLVVQLLPSGTWARYISRVQSRPGATVEHYKHPCLKPDLQFYREVCSLAAPFRGETPVTTPTRG